MCKSFYLPHFFIVLAVFSCRKDPSVEPHEATLIDPDLPAGLPPMTVPADNPFTQEGIALGRKLFYEKRLSGDNTLACAGCHAPEAAFSDPRQFSEGITGALGNRNSMALINLGYNTSFFWDGRAETLEDQVLEPVPNPIEMHQNWPDAVAKLENDLTYQYLFFQAFGTHVIDSIKVSKAMAQFLRTMVSGNSRFDQSQQGLIALNSMEQSGAVIFFTEEGDCFHCHGGPMFSSLTFHNNGLDAVHNDHGRAIVTGDPDDIGKFKAPTLRNIAYTAPYMHDGRFATLDEVINHYSEGVHWSPTIDPNMKKADQGGLHLDPQQKAQLKAFLLALSDPEFVNNPDFSDPE